MPVLGHHELGEGDAFVSELLLEGRLGTVPPVDRLLAAVLGSSHRRRPDSFDSETTSRSG